MISNLVQDFEECRTPRFNHRTKVIMAAVLAMVTLDERPVVGTWVVYFMGMVSRFATFE